MIEKSSSFTFYPSIFSCLGLFILYIMGLLRLENGNGAHSVCYVIADILHCHVYFIYDAFRSDDLFQY